MSLKCYRCGGELDTCGACVANCGSQPTLLPAEPAKACYRCPVCSGRGTVPIGFYASQGDGWVSAGTGTEQCKSCQGRGYICE